MNGWRVKVVNTYIGGKIIRPEGFRFAINIDPVQFLVYSSAFSRTALNHPLPRTNRCRLPLCLPCIVQLH
jgi:hypothetical protein